MFAVMDDPAKCGCNRSMAVICAVFAGAAVIALLAEDRCLDDGGRLSDVPWSCEFSTGAVASLWSLVTPAIAGTVAAVVAIPVYFAVSAIRPALDLHVWQASRLKRAPGKRVPSIGEITRMHHRAPCSFRLRPRKTC